MEDFSKYNGEGTLLRKAQLRMLDILIEVDKICRRHNIDYWLDSGTLIGAVRHGGFVPWDDDVDICVRREDYKKFRYTMIRELPERFAFCDWKTDNNFFDKCCRIRDRRSKFRYPLFSSQKESGLCVDVIIVERTIPVFKKVVDRVYGPVFRQVHNFGKALYKSEFKRRIFKLFSYMCLPFASILVFLSRSISYIFKVETYMMTYSAMFQSIRYEKDIFPLTDITFEQHKFLAPCDYDAYLRGIYGDYMKLPSESARLGHNVDIEIYD